MAIGGCPTAEDPVTVAVRCATCAREMVLATAGFRSSAGQRVQIRIGLHSGGWARAGQEVCMCWVCGRSSLPRVPG